MSGLHILRVPAAGQARAMLVAVPGLMESAVSMQQTLQHWARRGLEVLAVDPRGHDTSARWSKALLDQHAGDVIVADIVAAIHDAVTASHLPLVLFGHSAGGAAAAAIATEFLPRMGAVVLEDPFWRLPVTSFQDADVALAAGKELRCIKALSIPDRLSEIRLLHPTWPEDELDAWSRAKDAMDPTLVDDGHVIPSTGWPTLVAKLAAATVPVQVLTGTARIGMTANHRAILRSLGADVVVVRGATHFVRRDDRNLFHALTDRFLDSHVPAIPTKGTAPEAVASEMPGNTGPLRVAPRHSSALGGPSWAK